jgi:uncharacterized OB-fold protein
MPSVIAPLTDRDNRHYWQGVRDGKLLLQRCSGCGALRHPPRPMCPQCQSLDWASVPASGRGTLYSFVVSHHPSRPDAAPRIVALVDLEEGVRAIGNLQGIDWREVRNEIPVELFFEDFDGVVLPQFRLRAS